jgi:hypothetical protein
LKGPSERKAFTIQCKQGPCSADVSIFGAKDGLEIGSGKELVLSKMRPVEYLQLRIPAKSDFDRMVFAVRSDDGTVQMEHVGLDIFRDVNFKSQTEKTRMFFSVEASDE